MDDGSIPREIYNVKFLVVLEMEYFQFIQIAIFHMTLLILSNQDRLFSESDEKVTPPNNNVVSK